MKNKDTFIKSFLSVLVVVGLIACVLGIFNKAKKNESDGYEVIKPKFKLGDIQSTGKYVESDTRLYTENFYYCYGGMVITLDFKSTLSYQIHYYDYEDKYVGSSEVYSSGGEIDTAKGAVKCRFVLIPDLKAEGKEKLNMFSRYVYPRQITVKVIADSEFREGYKKTGVAGFETVVYDPYFLKFTEGCWTVYDSDGVKSIENRDIAYCTADNALAVNPGDVLHFSAFASGYVYKAYGYGEDFRVLRVSGEISEGVYVVPQGVKYVTFDFYCKSAEDKVTGQASKIPEYISITRLN